MKDKKTNLWGAIPNYIKAVAALLSAMTAVLVLLVQLGYIGEDSGENTVEFQDSVRQLHILRGDPEIQFGAASDVGDSNLMKKIEDLAERTDAVLDSASTVGLANLSTEISAIKEETQELLGR